MHPSVLNLLVLALSISAAPTPLNIPSLLHGSSKGFTLPITSLSAGGKATCVSGDIAVDASAANTRLNLTNPASQIASTRLFVEYFEPTSSLANRTLGGKTIVSGRFNINAKLCFPSALPATSVHTIQFLIHGINFDKDYWDIPGFSYIDAAAAAGYATFSYDRLGVGASDHPDPIQIVQSALQVDIAHKLIQGLRSGSIGGNAFARVVGVGHSYGSIQCIGVAAQHP
jgi:hypothetical protein